MVPARDAARIARKSIRFAARRRFGILSRVVAGGKITLREAQTIAYLLEHGRWPDAETAEWFEARASRQALDFLLMARLRGTIAAQAPPASRDARLRPVPGETGSEP